MCGQDLTPAQAYVAALLDSQLTTERRILSNRYPFAGELRFIQHSERVLPRRRTPTDHNTIMESDPSLRRAFLRYNDLYFDGRLPHDLTLYWEPSRGNLAETCELETLEDTGGTPDLVVRLDPTLRFSSRMWHFTLLHELVHVDLYPHRGHGKRFQKEMLRLANAGAFHKLW